MPLANEARPTSFDDMVGQAHLIGANGVLRQMLARHDISSCIFYGSPGTGKSTAAFILAEQSSLPYVALNATNCSVKDIQAAAKENPNGVLVYLDEVQYFNKKQQQSLLPYVEDGTVTLIAATTENPYHGVYKALVSRCIVLEFQPIATDDIRDRLASVLDARGLLPAFDLAAIDGIARFAAGDMRKALQAAELALNSCAQQSTPVSTTDLDRVLPHLNMGSFDTSGDQHYRYKSALQKSIRGSDPDAAVFWLMQMLQGGDILSPMRRMLVIAYEDIGMADPHAASIVLDACDAAERLGLPEAKYPLAQAAIYLATAPKSNSVGSAFSAAEAAIADGYGTIVPAHIAEECADGYVYPHRYPNHWVQQQYLPDDIERIGGHFYEPGENAFEQKRSDYWAHVFALQADPKARYPFWLDKKTPRPLM